MNLLRLGADVQLVSRVGRDKLGDAAIRQLQSLGLDTALVQRDEESPTGAVNVTLENGEPRFSIAAESAWDRIEISMQHFELVTRAAGFVFGTLAQRTPVVREALRSLLVSRPPGCRAICDLNLRPPFFDKAIVEQALRLADVVKLNEAELKRVSSIFETEEPVRLIFESYPVSLVAVTRGERGCTLFTRDERFDHAGFPLLGSTGDPVGAGDAFTAALAFELARGTPLALTAQLANDHARRVASAHGGFGFVA